MLNHEEMPVESAAGKKIEPGWFLKVFVQPKRTLRDILDRAKPLWLWPVLILTALALLRVIVSGPIHVQAAQMNAAIPPDFEYYTPDQQAQFQSAMAVNQGPVMVYVLPGLAAVLNIWVSWFLLGAILHLALTLNGSRSSNASAMNLAAWASLPLGLREIVRILSILFSHRLISAPGLSGFASGGYASAILAQVDLYFLWQTVLVLLGALHISGMARTKTWIVALTSILIVTALLSIPALILAKLGSIGSITPFLMF
jgi:hypothetical protein